MTDELERAIVSLVGRSPDDRVRTFQSALLGETINASMRVRDVLAALGQRRSDPHLLSPLMAAWSGAPDPMPASTAIALALGTAMGARDQATRSEPAVELVFTGAHDSPQAPGRPTATVIAEILRGASRRVLLMGYSVVPGPGSAEVVSLLADAVQRGVRVTLALDRTAVAPVMSLWPAGRPLPDMHVWEGPPEFQGGSLHAKLIAADGRDILVTSANLTFSGLLRNLEIGVRIRGEFTEEVERLVGFLQQRGYLKPWPSRP